VLRAYIRISAILILTTVSIGHPWPFRWLWDGRPSGTNSDPKTSVEANAPAVASAVVEGQTWILTGCVVDASGDYDVTSYEANAANPANWEAHLISGTSDEQGPPAFGYTSSHKHG